MNASARGRITSSVTRTPEDVGTGRSGSVAGQLLLGLAEEVLRALGEGPAGRAGLAGPHAAVVGGEQLGVRCRHLLHVVGERHAGREEDLAVADQRRALRPASFPGGAALGEAVEGAAWLGLLLLGVGVLDAVGEAV